VRRLIPRHRLLRAALFGTFAALVCACLSGTAAFAQRGARVGGLGRVGGVGRVGAARIGPPRVIPYGPYRPYGPYPRIFPRRLVYPIGPFFPGFVGPSLGFWEGPYFGLGEFGLGLGYNPIWWQNCGLLYSPYGCNALPAYYVFGGDERDLAQLYLTDGTIYNVTDYWLVDNQLHFTTVEESGTKVVEHTIDFNQLDLQKTIDADTQRGFRFVLRNEPIEQYLRDHPSSGTPALPQNAPPAGPASQPAPAPQQPR
jgi:hypothetical protein